MFVIKPRIKFVEFLLETSEWSFKSFKNYKTFEKQFRWIHVHIFDKKNHEKALLWKEKLGKYLKSRFEQGFNETDLKSVAIYQQLW